LRLTASWSDPQAPFEFQFVNPENRYYNWKSDSSLHSQPDNTVATEEFVIDDALPGNWLVNVRYIGDEKVGLIPPYLKYTLYKNYGTVDETKTVKLVRLDDQLQKVTLDAFTYSK
ncbi:MAG: hypothetical protein R3359_03535, partial [Marinirhabdus sp.]|nr:hypothetical protein [Marinirhabdus sp.]